MGIYVFKLPDVGEGIAEAEIVAWHVAPGDEVQEDQPFVDVMTDKATVEITSPVGGRVLSIEGEAGGLAAIGSVLAILDVGGVADRPAGTEAPTPPEATPPADPAPMTAQASARPSPAHAPRPQQSAPSSDRPTRGAGVHALASPAVRRRALEAGVRLERVPGSGPAGRISQADLEAYLEAPSAGPVRGRSRREGVEDVKVIGLRRRIAERMAEAKRRIPHFSYIEEIDLTELERLRAQLNAERPDLPRLTLLPFMVQALVSALPRFPQMNAVYDDEAGVVHRPAAVHVGIATQTPGGLLVPVLRHAEAFDLWDMAEEIGRLAAAARAGKARRDELSGSTITITSLGALGGVATTPVINRPEVAIIGPNRVLERPVVVGGAVVIRRMMNLSSSFDHRVVDGADAAGFVQAIKRLLETPALLFLEQP